MLKEDLGLSSLGLTGSRGILQYGVAFMKIISRRSNDRLFDNPIRGTPILLYFSKKSVSGPKYYGGPVHSGQDGPHFARSVRSIAQRIF